MRKIILSAVAVFAFGFTNAQEATSNAQATTSSQDTKFGIKAALNIASLTGDVDNPSSLTGFQIGGFAEIKVSEKFAIQPELMYSTQGGTESVSYSEFISGIEVEVNGDAEYKLSYLNIPVMAKYYATPKFSFEFGPQIGFLLSAKNDWSASATGGGVSFSESGSEDIKDSTSSIDFGLNLGAGYDFTEHFGAGVRYNFGLTTVDDEGDYEIKNGVLSISLGYKF